MTLLAVLLAAVGLVALNGAGRWYVERQRPSRDDRPTEFDREEPLTGDERADNDEWLRSPS